MATLYFHLQQKKHLTNQPNKSEEILELFAKDPDKGMELMFRTYFGLVSSIVYRVLNDSALAEDISQEVFLSVWKNRETIKINSSLKSYLATAARNKALNYIRDNKVKFAGGDEMPEVPDMTPGVEKEIAGQALKKRVTQLIDLLPERCRHTFVLSRFENLTYKQIAVEMGISEKTVENQISKALAFLRTGLASFLDEK